LEPKFIVGSYNNMQLAFI